MNALLEAALQYAGRGWRVIPLHSTAGGACSCGQECGTNAGKHPRVKQSEGRWGSSDAEQIGRWWRRWPTANVGLETGYGLVVIDVDDAVGAAELAGIAQGRMPPTLVSVTGRGFHLYLAGEASGSHKVGRLLLRGTGGYVVAPPSLHRSGARYAWRDGTAPLAEIPLWFKENIIESVRAPISGKLVTPIPGEIPSFLAKRASAPLRTVGGEPWNLAEEARIRAALWSIPPSCPREPWLSAGMALHALQWERSDGTNIGFDLWREWSSGCPDKFSEHDVEVRWQSFKRSGITIGTLFHLAQAAGWDGSVPSLPAPNTPTPWAVPGGTQRGEVIDASSSRTTLPPGNGVFPAGSAVSEFQPSKEVMQHSNDLRSAGSNKTEAPPLAVGPTLNGANGHHALPLAITMQEPIRFPDRDARGKPRSTVPNARAVIDALALDCRHDTFHERLRVGGRSLENYAGDASDYAEHALRVIAYREFSVDIGRDAMHDAIVQACLSHPFDPVHDYLKGLQWDGKKRLDSWLRYYLGAEDSDLNAAIGRLALMAAVRRVREPGAKFDQIVVLESEEGFGKSSAIEVLAGEANFSDQSILTLSENRQQEAVQGVWLYEIADLVGKSRADVERVKAFCSRRVDRARPAYGRHRVDRPRRCIFVGTTNEATYLRSQTGNRRFWPVKVGRVRIDELARDRDQLWAEAFQRESGTRLVLEERLWQAAREAQEGRREHDIWDDILAGVEKAAHGVVRTPEEIRVTSRHLIGTVLGLGADRITDTTSKRLAHTIRRLGWDGPKNIRLESGEVARGYVRAA